MVPNFIWFAVPAGYDILRCDSVTPVIDMIASFIQVLMLAALCIIKNEAYQAGMNKKWIISIIVTVFVYYVSWCLYYFQITSAVVILILCIVPCITFIVYSLGKRNGVALILALLFMICHMIYALENFIC